MQVEKKISDWLTTHLVVLGLDGLEQSLERVIHVIVLSQIALSKRVRGSEKMRKAC